MTARRWINAFGSRKSKVYDDRTPKCRKEKKRRTTPSHRKCLYESLEDRMLLSVVPSGWWKFNETSGPNAADFSGHNLTGTLSGGATLVGAASKLDAGVSLDGTDDYMLVNDASHYLDNTSTLTISAWINTDTLGAVHGILSERTSASDNSAYAMYLGSDNQLHVNIAGTTALHTTCGFAVGTWYNVAVTFNGSTTTATLYVNGVQNGTPVTNCSASIPSDTAALAVGCLQTGSSSYTSYFDGMIDDVRITKSVLTADEIAGIYNCPLAFQQARVIKDANSLISVISTDSHLTSNQKTSYITELNGYITTVYANTSLESGAYPTDSVATIRPLDTTFSVLDTSVLGVQAKMWQADYAGQNLVAWKTTSQWDPMCPTTQPNGTAVSLSVTAMKGEARSAAFNVSNTTNNDLYLYVNVSNLPSGATATVQYGEWIEPSVTSDVTVNVTNCIGPLPFATYVSGKGYQIPIRPGMTREIWLTFTPGASTVAGTYSPTVSVNGILQSDNTTSVGTVTVSGSASSLRVSSLSFPSQPALSLSGCDWTDLAGTALQQDVTTTNLDAYITYLGAHYVDTIWAGDYPGTPGGPPVSKVANPANFTAFDTWVNRWYTDTGVYPRNYLIAFPCDYTFDGHDYRTDLNGFNAAVASCITAYANHCRQIGIDPSQLELELVDEVSTTDQSAMIVVWANAIHAANTGVKVWENSYITNPSALVISGSNNDVFDVSDIICPNRDVFVYTPSYTQTPNVYGADYDTFYRYVHSPQGLNKSLQFYACQGPTSSMAPYTDYRLMAWTCFKEGATAETFYSFADLGGCANWKTGYSMKWLHYSPLYLDSTSVTDSRAMEAIKEGVQDNEYLTMLQNQINEFNADGTHSATAQNLQNLLTDAVSNVLGASGATNIWWNTVANGTIADAQRERVLNALEQPLAATIVTEPTNQAVNLGQTATFILDTPGATSIPSPMGWWKLDEATGVAPADSSGAGHTGTLVGTAPTSTNGVVNGALTFNGTNQVRVDNVAVNTAAGGTNTVSFWMKWDGTDSVMPFGWNTGYDLWIKNGYIGFNTAHGDLLGVTFSQSQYANKWVHVAAMFYNGVPSAQTVQLYINGDCQPLSQVLGTPTSSTATSTIFMSGWGYNGSYRFSGVLDNVQVYAGTLSAEAIALQACYYQWQKLNGSTWQSISGAVGAYYTTPPTGSGDNGSQYHVIASNFYGSTTSNTVTLYVNPSPAGWWKLDEATGVAPADSSGAGHTGTLVGTAPTSTNGIINGALTFNGTNQVRVDNVAVNTAAGGTNTVSFWMKWGGTDSVMPFGWNTGYDLWIKNGYIGFNTAHGDLLGAGFSQGQYANKWVHIAAVFYNGVPSAQTVQLYINGVRQQLSQVLGTPASSTATSTIFMSGWGYDGSYRFSGVLDNVLVYAGSTLSAEASAEQARCPVVYLKFNETSGTASDSSGNGYAGTLTNGAVFTTSGYLDGGVAFDGTDDYVSVPDVAALKYKGTDMTLSAWVYANPTETDGAYLISKPWNGVTDPYNYQLGLNSGTNPTVFFSLQGSSPTSAYTITSPSGITEGFWHHIAATVNSAGLMTLYIDGISVASGTNNITAWAPTDGNKPLVIGSKCSYSAGNYSSSTLDGKMDNVHVYNRALRAADIAVLAIDPPSVGGQAATATVRSMLINDGDAQRSRVNSVTIPFSQIVSMDAGAFDVLKLGTGGGLVNVVVTPMIQNDRTVATLAFSGDQTEHGSLKDGEYQLTIRDDKVRDNVTGATLDGNGEGLTGGDYLSGSRLADNFFRKFGDSDSDRNTDGLGLLRLKQSHLTLSNLKWHFDFNSDEDTDGLDLLGFKQRYLT